jgi:endonuclease/exonuclease/phosphatase family metal-dependent hydrolase
LQEGLVHQLAYIQESLKAYRMIGVGRDDGKEKGEYTAIFYDTTKLKLLEHSTFWLSDTPETVSVGWDAALERICTYGLFENIESRKQIYVLNTHYDHIGKLARVNSSKLLSEKIGALNRKNIPIILMGDFNSTPEEEAIKILAHDLVDGGATGIYGPLGTFNAFDKKAVLEDRIDFIFYKDMLIESYRNIDDKMKNGNWVSDHLPVLIKFQ